MKKTLYLVRHGQTLFNYFHKMQGYSDSPLTEIGIKQAKIARDYFKNNNITFDNAYSSTSERASDTLEIITDNKISYTRLKEIKEINFGILEGQDEYLVPWHIRDKKDAFFKDCYGESEEEFESRIVNAIENIMTKENHNNVIIVSHGGVCRQFARYHLKDSKLPSIPKRIPNCTIFKYEFENGIFSLIDCIQHDFSKIENIKLFNTL